MNLPIKQLQRFAVDVHDQLLSEVANRLSSVLADFSPERVESPELVAQIEKQISRIGEIELTKLAAYTWFNRVIALRFMDVNQYNSVRIVSPAQGNTGLPDLLLRAKAGTLPDSKFIPASLLNRVKGLLEGTISPLPGWPIDQEVFRLLLVAKCNELTDSMPYLFERISAYLALLLPRDLLSPNSFLSKTVTTLSGEVCGSVEVIGWLYQFYISSEKDQAFARIKNGQKVKPNEIPAITQLFTPHYIVRYIVENSIGRLWLDNNPNSEIREKLTFLSGTQPAEDYLRISGPKDITVMDPAVGSGHMLTYAFDVLFEIYLESGYAEEDIPSLILQNNLFGIEIDGRAAALASFALAMKAQSRDPNFLARSVLPQIEVLSAIKLTNSIVLSEVPQLNDLLKKKELQKFFEAFGEADSIGSMVSFNHPDTGQILQEGTEALKHVSLGLREGLSRFLEQANLSTKKFACVIANPPYMGAGKMDKPLSDYLRQNYADSKADLCIAFIERALQMCKPGGFASLVTMQTWMHQESYVKLRANLLSDFSLQSLVHLGSGAFDSISGEVVTTCAFTWRKSPCLNSHETCFINVTSGQSEFAKEQLLLAALKQDDVQIRKQLDFLQFPGHQIMYKLDKEIAKVVSEGKALSEIAKFAFGLVTGKNDKYLRLWHEVDFSNFTTPSLSSEIDVSTSTWVSAVKGGGVRRWYGNLDHVIDWRESATSKYLQISGRDMFFQPAGTWSLISNQLNLRYFGYGHAIEHAGPAVASMPESKIETIDLVGLLNSLPLNKIVQDFAPGTKKLVSDISALPVVTGIEEQLASLRPFVREAVNISKIDWDSSERSWNFQSNVLAQIGKGSLASAVEKHLELVQEQSEALRGLEEELNRGYLKSYGLESVFDSKVNIEEVTLSRNIAWAYTKDSQENGRSKYAVEVIKELISYSVGCMFGRYSLDSPGLKIAGYDSDGESLRERNSNTIFRADEDNVIPILEDDSFEDDVISRFREFIRVAFGEADYEENMAYIERKLEKDIRKYFSREFYLDHLKRYKNRPIYWLSSSSNGKFKALFYIHRYKASLFSTMRTDYLLTYKEKIESRIDNFVLSGLGNPEPLRVTLAEINEFDQNIMHKLASKRISIDLDDGVKENYRKFGEALFPIKGMKNDD